MLVWRKYSHMFKLCVKCVWSLKLATVMSSLKLIFNLHHIEFKTVFTFIYMVNGQLYYIKRFVCSIVQELVLIKILEVLPCILIVYIIICFYYWLCILIDQRLKIKFFYLLICCLNIYELLWIFYTITSCFPRYTNLLFVHKYLSNDGY